jgi:hypothetical protein
MSNIEFPADVIRELNTLRGESERAIGELFRLEREQVEAEIVADVLEARALLDAKGTVAEKEAWATIHSADARKVAEIAKIKVSYAKNRMRQLSEAINAVQTASRMIDLQFRTEK